MTDNRTSIFEKISSDLSFDSQNEAIKHYHAKSKIKIGYEAFRVAYFRWVKKKKNEKIQIRPTTKFIKPKQIKVSNEFHVFGGNKNEFNFPASKEEPFENYTLPKNVSRWGLICDVHVPYHNLEALTIAIKELKQSKIEGLVINGDLIDFYAISSFLKDPRKRNLGDEVIRTRQFFEALRNVFPNIPIIYKGGNHEARYDRFIIEKMPDFLALNEFDLPSVLRLSDQDITYVHDTRIILMGKLHVVHGHEIGKSFAPPVNVARGLYLKTKVNTICGHHHQTSEHAEKSLDDKVVGCWSVGCLAELKPDYARINKYNHGFAEIELDNNGDFEVRNRKIINGKAR